MLGLKRSYIKDCKDNLRSGSGQLNKKYWHECHELWGGSAGTEPFDFGVETLSTETEIVESVDEENVDRAEIAREEDVSVDVEGSFEVQTCDDSRSVSPSLTESSHSEGEAKVGRKRAKSTKTFVDNKREKLQKKLTQEGKQDILLQHSQKQLELQQAMIEGLTKKDEGLEAAMKSMAESSAMLNKTLATGLQFMFSAMQHPGNMGYPSSNQPGFNVNNYRFNHSQYSPLNPHMPATQGHADQHHFDGYAGEYTHMEFND